MYADQEAHRVFTPAPFVSFLSGRNLNFFNILPLITIIISWVTIVLHWFIKQMVQIPQEEKSAGEIYISFICKWSSPIIIGLRIQSLSTGMELHQDIFMKCWSLPSADIAQDHRWHWTYLCGKQIQVKKAYPF